MKKLIAALIGFAAIALSESAIAQTAAHKDELNNIIVSGTGLPRGTLVRIYYPQVFDSRTVTPSGACNLLTIKSTSSFAFNDWIKVGGVQLSLDQGFVATLAGSPCVNGVPNTAYSWINAGAYRYVESADRVFVIAPSAAPVVISGDLPNFRLGKSDACGRISIRNSEKWPIAGLNFGDGTFSYIVNGSYGPDIPIPTTNTAAMPICRRGILYRPLNP